MQAPPIFYLRRLICHLHGRKKRTSLSALFILIMGSPPYQLLQQPSAEAACNLCRGAQAVTAIYRRKGRFGGIVNISGGNFRHLHQTTEARPYRSAMFCVKRSPPYQRRVWEDCKYKWRPLRHLHQTTEARQIARFYRCFGGGGGSRTRVQTGSPRAFYTFSYRLVLLRASGRQQPNTRPSF